MKSPFKFGLVGRNITYSKSPDIFRAIFEIKGVKGEFEVFDLGPSNFEHEFKSLLSRGVTGLSVTIPYKSRVIPLLNNVTPVARSLDAVNSIAINTKRLYGYNTDVFGFSIPLKSLTAQLRRGHALILGSGGGAAAAVYSLHTDYEMGQFTVLGRDRAKLEHLKKSLRTFLINSRIETSTISEFKPAAQYSIVVNCTPLGGWNASDQNPLPDGFIWPMTKIYYDLNYNQDNKVISDAARNSVATIDGAQMLVGQAVRSFELWTGEYVSFEEVYRRVFSAAPQNAT